MFGKELCWGDWSGRRGGGPIPVAWCLAGCRLCAYSAPDGRWGAVRVLLEVVVGVGCGMGATMVLVNAVNDQRGFAAMVAGSAPGFLYNRSAVELVEARPGEDVARCELDVLLGCSDIHGEEYVGAMKRS